MTVDGTLAVAIVGALVLRSARLQTRAYTWALVGAATAVSVVMELLGHSQLSETLKRYTKVRDQLQRDAIDRLDALLRDELR